MLPRILDIKGFDGVLMHRGNTADHSHGCILVGYKKGENSIFESTKAEADLVDKLMKHNAELHTIEIV